MVVCENERYRFFAFASKPTLTTMDTYQKIAGCLMGGALGDALGWPVEFLSRAAILRKYGSEGIKDLDLAGKPFAEVSDDTQMTLFSVDGILRYLAKLKYSKRPVSFESTMYEAYRRWLFTQQAPTFRDKDIRNGWLYDHPVLHAQRAPGNSCITALNELGIGTIQDPINSSKGCGGVMRSAPFGLVFDAEEAFQKGCAAAALTHGHPTGYLSSGAFSQIIAHLLEGKSLTAALGLTLHHLKQQPESEEVVLYLQKAFELANEEIEPLRAIEALGEGWVAEEALAIAVYCALKFPDDSRIALRHAVNHDGDSDSTGAICGNLIGAWHGIQSLDPNWIEHVEGKELILQAALDLSEGPSLDPDWLERYPI